MIKTTTSRKGIYFAEDSDVNFGIAEVHKMVKIIGSMWPQKKIHPQCISPHEGLLGDHGHCSFFKTTHEKANHTGCLFGTHASTKHLLKGEFVVSQNNVYEVTETIKCVNLPRRKEQLALIYTENLILAV